MVQRRPGGQRVVRNRRVAIYTFLLILTLFYISAHRTVQKKRELEASRAETTAEGPGGQARELAGGWSGRMPEEVVGRQTGGQPKEPVQEQPEGLPGARVYKERGGMDADGSLKILPGDMWYLVLTNTECPVLENYEVKPETIPGAEQSVDKRIYEPLITMIDDMKDQRLSPTVCSGYRTLDRQEKLFNREVLSFVKTGHTEEESYNLARQIVSIPGLGEHCLGLAMGSYTRRYHKLEKVPEDTLRSKWLMRHAQDYDFVMRYGENKTDITGVQYEPRHYRYVGVEVANYMKDNGSSLEELYIEQGLYG